jgi:pSer/pThr/pTyr-binding forkhead associated (FHA) protein
MLKVGEKPMEGKETEVGTPPLGEGFKGGSPLPADPLAANGYKLDSNLEAFGPDTPPPPAIRYFGEFEATPVRPKAPLLFGDVMKNAVEVALRAFGYFVPPPPLPGPVEGLTVGPSGKNVFTMPSKWSTAFLGREAVQATGISPIVVPNDPSVSRMHAGIHRNPDGTFTIEDLGSKTGTYVNGAKIKSPHTPQALKEGDVIRIGGTDITFQGDAHLEAFGPDTPAPEAVRLFRGDAIQRALASALRAFDLIAPLSPNPAPGLGKEGGVTTLHAPSDRKPFYLGSESASLSGVTSILVPGDPKVSKMHASIQREKDGSFTLKDLSSTSGTFVNGERIKGPTTIKAGDVIRMGGTEITFLEG